MKYELSGISNGIKLYNPVPENEVEKRQLKINEEIFYDTLAKIILKYGPKVLEEIEKEKRSED